MKTIDVVAAIIYRNGKVLLAQRNQAGDQPGLWEFPGGKVEVGETQPQALVRELREELGISACVSDYIATARREVAGREIQLHAWQVNSFSGEPQLLCHQALIWCAPEEAERPDLAPADRPLLRAFMALRDARPAD